MSILFYITTIAFLVYLGFKIKVEVHMMQQNSYFNSRYTAWLLENLKKRALWWEIVGLLGCAMSMFFYENNPTISSVGGVLVLLMLAYGIYFYATEVQKKALVITPRVRRLLAMCTVVSLLLSFGIWYFVAPCTCNYLYLMVVVLSPLTLLLGSTLMLPIENGINQSYVNDAKRKLESMTNLTVIGVTGSYGKTSVKHFLARILSEKYDVLHTPGSVNTTLGVVRIVREQLKPTHQIFIAEMGAKKMGDVKELCDLVQPDMAILTAIGPEHLDTFGSMENVQKGNFELIESLKKEGKGFMNADYDLVKAYNKTNTTLSFYGIQDQSAAYTATNIIYTATGMQFDMCHNGLKIITLETKLLGEHNVSNIVGCVAIALELKIEPNRIAYAVRNLQPVQHRLEIKRNPGGITIIDDAFNSNPTGSRMALEVLSKVQGNKKIVVTPGMIELGDEEYEYNRKFGTYMLGTCDYVILVGPKQTKPIQDGLRDVGYPQDCIYVAKDLTDASQHLRTFVRVGDVVLYENDLPDTYKE
jgi:UDP-N-acetylmuramoyl-tripeptide--D-alanyl-D-alanine ligase